MTGCMPEIRFKGFTDAWEQRKLGDIAERVMRKNGNMVSSLPLTISAQYGLIDQNEFFDKRIASKDVSGYYLIENGEFAYNKSTSNDAIWGAIKRLDRYKNGVLSTLYIVFKIKDFKETNPDFLVSYYSTNLWHKGIQAIASEGARNHGLLNIVPSDFFGTTLFLPKEESEQKQIGVCFQSLDNLITLHQRKLESLKKVKKSLLDKMFPKEGETKPEIRFKGFNDDWEQRELGKIGTTFTGLSGKSKEDFGHGDARFITYMNVFTNAISTQAMTENVEIDNRQNEVKYGDVFFTTSSETPEEVGMSSIWLFNTPKVYLNSFCFGYRPNIKLDPYYLAFMLRSPGIRKKFTFLAQGISRYNISKNKVMEMTVPIPDNEEQKRVGEFFYAVDNLITLHQRKLESLKKIKKSLLGKMFPKEGEIDG